jgi:uncharacterized surface protein with fasciclin (FAS1) repeats
MEHKVTIGSHAWLTALTPSLVAAAIVVSFSVLWYAWQIKVDTAIATPVQWKSLATVPAGSVKSSSGIYRTGSTRVREQSDVVGVAARLTEASYFNDLLRTTGVASALRGSGDTFTLFIPTDGSISQLPSGTIRNLSSDELRRYVEYHIITGKAVDISASSAGVMQAQSGDKLNFSYGADKIPKVGNGIIISTYPASNGLVYLIDDPLLPPQKSNI